MEEKNKYDRAIEAVDNFAAAMKEIGIFESDFAKQTEMLKEAIRFAEFEESKYAAGKKNG